MTVSPSPKTPAEFYEEFFVPGMFRPLADQLLRIAAPQRGSTVLDLACGTGIVARRAAPRIGDSGRIVALDLRPGMIAAASAIASPEGAVIEWKQGDATALDLPDSTFDLVLCQQGLQFFPDLAQALREVGRVLKPGGQAAFALWQPVEQQGLFAEIIPFEVAHLEKLGMDTSDVDLPFSLGDQEELRQLLADTGFNEIAIREVAIETDFPAADFIGNVEFAYSAVVPEFANDPALYRSFVDDLSSDTEAALRRYTTGDRIRFEMRANVATARH